MTNVAIVTARGNNQSMPDKNLISICNNPAIEYPIAAALSAKEISDVFVTTECVKIKKASLAAGAKIIDRPPSLSLPDTNHGDVIVHAARFIKEHLCPDLNIVTVLLGNMVMITSDEIDQTIQLLRGDPEADSCMTVWKAQDDHPYRSMQIKDNGYLDSFLRGIKPDTNRQSYPDVYFYNQGPWTVKYSTLETNYESPKGPGPWWWMGEKCIPLEQEWVTGRDFHGTMDLWISEHWLTARRITA